MDEEQIRTALKRELASLYQADIGTVILEELGLRHGAARVDLVVVNGCLHGFEIKSDLDSLKRLPRQAQLYSGVLDYLTLVATPRHLNKGMRLIPTWWGVKLIQLNQDGKIVITEVREPTANPVPDKVAIAKLLWRCEALELLDEFGLAAGLRSKPRATIHARAAEAVDFDSLRARVRRQLRCRTTWRSAELQTSGGG